MTQSVKPSLKNIIEREVMRIVGRPPMFDHIEACHTQGRCWRVNIWTKHPVPSGNLDNGIPYSFFIIVDTEGRIIHSDPRLVNLFLSDPTPTTPSNGANKTREPAPAPP